MKLNRVARSVARVSGTGLAVVPMAFAATPSFAAADCGEGIEVAAGICEKAFTTAGDFTFTVPASVSKMSAVLVGGGGGAAVYGAPDGSYGGGGGEVIFVDSVAVSSPLSVTVGAGGGEAIPYADASNGGMSALGLAEASGGFGATFEYGGGVSGNGNAGSNIDNLLGAGGGAGSATTDCVAGAGLTASVASAGSSLFPAVSGEAVLGGGGSCLDVAPGSFTGTAGSGGSVSGNPVLAEAGEDGAVIIRWASAALADTGVYVQPWVIGASLAAVLGGAVLAAGAVRRLLRGVPAIDEVVRAGEKTGAV